jgi:hypothetical protein
MWTDDAISAVNISPIHVFEFRLDEVTLLLKPEDPALAPTENALPSSEVGGL